MPSPEDRTGLIRINRMLPQSRISFNHRHLALSNLAHVQLRELRELFDLVNAVMRRSSSMHLRYAPIQLRLIEQMWKVLGEMDTIVWVPRASTVPRSTITCIDHAIKVFGPTNAAFIATFGVHPAQMATLARSQFFAVLTDDEEADAGDDLDAIYRMTGKSFYDPTRRQTVNMLRAMLIFFARVRSADSVRAIAERFGMASSAVSNHALFFLNRITYYFGYLLEPEVSIQRFAPRFAQYNASMMAVLRKLKFHTKKALLDANFEVRFPFCHTVGALDGTFHRIAKPSKTTGDIQLAYWNGYYHGFGFLHLVGWGPDGLAMFDYKGVGSTNDNALTNQGSINSLMMQHAPQFYLLGDSIFANLSNICRVPNAQDCASMDITAAEVEDIASVRSQAEHGFNDLWRKGKLLCTVKHMKIFWTRPLALIRGALVVLNIITVLNGNQTTLRFLQRPPQLGWYLVRNAAAVVDGDVAEFTGIEFDGAEGEDDE